MILAIKIIVAALAIFAAWMAFPSASNVEITVIGMLFAIYSWLGW